MAEDPFHGDTRPLKGRKWKGYYRKRVGRYRVIFLLRLQDRIIDIYAVVPKPERTYR
jgi:mRNA-degrading endonuclease RelE of RelBE toxin-antitoxin system